MTLSQNMRGAILMMSSMAAFTFNDALIKATDGTLPLFQILVLRGLIATGFLLILAWRDGALRVRGTLGDWTFVAIRSVAEICAAYCFLTALLNMPLANATAILQILPLAVTLGAALFFQEQVGWRRMAAVAAGFVGMLLVVRPGPDGFNSFSLFAMAAVICVTVRDLATRRISPAMPSLTVTLSASLSVFVFSGLVTIGAEWVPVDGRNWGLIIASAIFIIGAYSLSVLVMRVGDISFVAPFRYSGLLWALLLGWFLFDEWPDALTLIGASIVVASGVFTLYRETVL